jgi:hypothetical protein
MINIVIMGGLGNQLFQWACARNLQEKYGHYINYNLDFFSSQNLRTFQLNEFENLNLNSKEDSNNFYLYAMNVGDDFYYENFCRNDFSKKEKLYNLCGYWQSEKYFQENSHIIKKDLDISESLLYNLKEKYNWLGSENTVSLHVRRTDYINIQNHHPIPTIQYYKDALDLIEHDKVVVFSDDINWCKENFKFNNTVFIEGNSNIDDLYLMSMCNNNVIANSSFSWWAAWLNKNKSKKVVAPKVWFGPAAPSDKDIIPDKWVKI